MVRRDVRFQACTFAIALAGCAEPSMVHGPPRDQPCDRCFDRGATTEVLRSITPDTCRELAGLRGEFHVATTFAPDGSVANATFDEEPKLAHTPRGACVLERFRSLHIPAFEGEPVTVGKRTRFE